MIINQYIKRLFLILIFLISCQGFSQLSKTHYIPPLTFANDGNATPEDQYIYLSTPSVADIPYTIIPVGQPTTSYVTGVVSNNNPATVSIGTGSGQLFVPSAQTSTITTNKGYIIEAEGVIYVSVRANAGSQAGALVSKGISALGTTFRVGSFTNESSRNDYLSFVSVMASEDNTQVTFSDLPPGLVIENYNNTFPINITLNKSESYIIGINTNNSFTNRDGLIGALVSSDKPIVVNCGSTNGSFGSGGGRDYGIDQIVDFSKVGTEYIFVRGNGNDSWENVLIVPHTFPTDVFINGNTTPITITATDKYLAIEGNNYNINGNMYVETSQPVFAYQGVGGLADNGLPSEANQGMFFVPPLSCEARGNLDNIALINNIGSINYQGGVSIVTTENATVTINNESLSNQPTGVTVTGPSTVNGKTDPDYVTYKVTGLTGNVSVQSSDELYAAYFNYNGAATSGSFYSGFPSPPEINFDALFATLGNCIPNITLEAANTQNFDSYEWWFDDGTGFKIEASNVPSITPNNPGKYKLKGIITCTGVPLESVEVPVSICPDDIDNDGIIDNIDIDNDNDGIQNCTESKGDVSINIIDTDNPELIFQDNSTNNTMASASLNQNNSSGNTTNIISGTNTGDFTSIVQPASSAESSYDMLFNEAINIKFSEATSNVHIATSGEYFIAKILPSSKNITLVDPDNRLLVDSNFDGDFEPGITQISGSEIHFKYNPTPAGNTPYAFYANQVDGFSFIHKLGNSSNASTFTGNISLTCYKNDNDNDGLEDALDLDSDNDGIPDFIENDGFLIALSGIDADLNGLDDVYDINALPIDTDGDTILDFYDLDSDNDGITDLIETGQLGLLSDTDLNGIEDGPTYGVNGWADAAETAPDSNVIGYILNDFDADTIFSYIDADSDGDGCSDVLEAGFSDANGDDYLGEGIVEVDLIADSSTGQGLVINASDGYTIPNSDYLDNAPITITIQPSNLEVCEGSDNNISLISTTFDTIQWEVSTDGTNWNTIVDDAVYSNSQTSSLLLTNTPFLFNSYFYRALLNRNGNACGLYSDIIQIIIKPLPTINSPVTLIQCDNDIDGVSFFNLTEANDEISSDAINETFTYYLSNSAAISGDVTSTDYISSPTTYENNSSPFSDMVWARVENSLGCSSVLNIQLNVGVSQIPAGTINEVLNRCDDFLDINGNDNTNNDDRDGIATFDFSYVKKTVEDYFLPQTPTVTFYKNEADALAENDAITNLSNYRNIGYPNMQQIYVRVDSQIGNDCQAFGPYITLNVEALPTANPVTFNRQCDIDVTDTVINFPFDTSQLESDILDGQNATISYFTETGTQLLIGSTFLTESQNIIVRVTNNFTQDPDGACFDETTISFIVDEQPVIADTIPAQIECDGNAGDIDDDGIFPFPTTSFTNIILGIQPEMDIAYNYINENGDSITNSPTLPNPFNSGNQTITVEVFNPINFSCSATTTVDFVVNPLPEFEVESPRIVCSSDPTFNISLEPLNVNSSETFTYEWNFEGDFKSTNAVLDNVSTPGTYSITLTKTDGAGCSRTRDIVVEASEIAYTTIEDITIVDISDNNTVTIDNSNIGRGNYEFALIEEDSNIINYQTEPVFTNVRAGFYTLFIRESICGVIEIPLSVIGSRKFFTPNGDGINDFWQIQGIDENTQPNTIISIFDRYGKLIKQMSPTSRGWDGTFNGNRLPTDDYWFKVSLEDGRTFMGHFTLKR